MNIRVITVVVVLAIALAIPQVRFWQQDGCLDAGGVWTTDGCESARFETSLSWRLLILISIVSLGFSGLVVAATRVVLLRARSGRAV